MRSKTACALLALGALTLATTTTRPAEAFCGFYVAPSDAPLYADASMVALMRDGNRTVISMSNNYKGPASDFAMVVPVPVVLQKANVKVLDKQVFTHLEQLSAPRLVEYWEQDPCSFGEGGLDLDPSVGMKGKVILESSQIVVTGGVKIEARFSVGEYDVLILSAKDSGGLEKWLHQHKYNVPQGAAAALAPYVKEQQKFFVAKVDVNKVTKDANGVAVLSPLRFSYESADFRLPVRLGLLNAQGKQDLIIYTLSRSVRYEPTNYPSVFIPTNLDVTDATRDNFGSFYATLFDQAVAKGNGRGIVTEYSWSSNGCDPCPTPPLDPIDVATLGGDVLFGSDEGIAKANKGKPTPKAGKAPPMPPPQPFAGMTPMILTRMHARYDSVSLSDDIIFGAAPAVIGGRELKGPGGKVEDGAQPSSMNAFQARYVIRHSWTGALTCAKPLRGIWGGKPGYGGTVPPVPATNLAAATRNVVLEKQLKAGIPAFQVKTDGVLSTIAGIPAPVEDAGPITEDVGNDVAPPSDASFGDANPSTVPSVEPSSRGCGCTVIGGSDGADFLVLGGIGAFVGLTLVGRRKRRSR